MAQVKVSPVSNPGTTMSFSDGRSCKEWLKTIPLTNIPHAQELLLDALRVLNKAEFAPIERLTCLELMRDKVAFLQAEQRARFSGKTVPLGATDMAGWQVSYNVVQEMEAGYRKSFEEGTGGAVDVEAHLALIVQRIMRYIGLQMLFAGMIYRRFDPALWTRLHLQWIEAESRGLTQKSVRDSVGSIDGTSSVAAAYIAILLAQLANTYELAPRQIDFVDALLKRFAAKVTIEADPAKCADLPLVVVDLFGNTGATAGHGEEAADHLRFLRVDELSKSLRRRIIKLGEGENPALLNLPSDWSAQDSLLQLKRAHRLWCEGGGGGRPHGIVPEETRAQLAFGINDLHFFVSGQAFEQPGKKRELTRQELNDITMFGKLSEATLQARTGGNMFVAETWGIVDEGKGHIRVLRPGNASHGVAIGRLVGLRVGGKGPILATVIREIVQDLDGALTIVLGMLPGMPEAVAVRSADSRTRTSGNFLQAVRLPAVAGLNSPQTLVVPTGLAQLSRGLDLSVPNGDSREVTVSEFVERGVDFDRIAVF